MKVGYQGEPGAFSEEAVEKLFPGAEALPYPALRPIFDDVATGALSHGVVPLENSQAGSVNEAYDLLARGAVTIVGEVVVRVDHALLALPGTRLEDVRRVSSHPQALDQCQEFLASLAVEVQPVYDTAGAAKRIAEEGRKGEAAIASERAARMYGLAVLATRVQTYPDNRTRFAAIAADPTPLGRPDKTSIIFGVRDQPGALYRALRPFAQRALNLSKLESRPLGERPFEYRFYLDIEAPAEDVDVRDALAELEEVASFVQVIGSYPRWPEDAGEAPGRARPEVIRGAWVDESGPVPQD